MMLLVTLNLFILITLSNVHSVQFLMAGTKNSDTYGPYVVIINNFTTCSHSDSYLAKISTSLIVERNTDYKTIVNITLPQAIRIVKMKVVIYSVTNNLKNLLWDYTIENPCQNPVVLLSLKGHLDVRSCVLKKGIHSITTDRTKAAKLFFGNSFFYGHYIYMFTLISTRNQDILCVTIDENISKKP